jgi:hypothetical protein
MDTYIKLIIKSLVTANFENENKIHKSTTKALKSMD